VLLVNSFQAQRHKRASGQARETNETQRRWIRFMGSAKNAQVALRMK
jgi:hypothetical protein